MIEVAIRLRCEMEADVSTDVIARIESNRCHQLFERLVDQDSIAGLLTMNEPRFRAVEPLKSVAGEQRYEAGAGRRCRRRSTPRVPPPGRRPHRAWRRIACLALVHRLVVGDVVAYPRKVPPVLGR